MVFRYGYTGREFDKESGLYYYRSRPYDPTVGRFIQEDKIGFGGGDSNLSRYVFDNPVSLTDPTGEILPFLVIAGLSAVASGLIDYNVQGYTNYGNIDPLRVGFAAISGGLSGGAGTAFTVGKTFLQSVLINTAVNASISGGSTFTLETIQGKSFDDAFDLAKISAGLGGVLGVLSTSVGGAFSKIANDAQQVVPKSYLQIQPVKLQPVPSSNSSSALVLGNSIPHQIRTFISYPKDAVIPTLQSQVLNGVGSGLNITFSNSGSLVDPNALDKIFKPFFTSHPVGKCTTGSYTGYLGSALNNVGSYTGNYTASALNNVGSYTGSYTASALNNVGS